MTLPPAPPLPRRVTLLVLCVFLAVLLRTAWISDDAMISLRAVMNVTHGHGLTQNVAERVQSFTHPLWVLVLSAAYLVAGNVYYATVAASLLVSLAAIWMALTRAASRERAVLAAAALLCSRAFIDFATSGLENPLSYVLLAAFLAVYARGGSRVRLKPDATKADVGPSTPDATKAGAAPGWRWFTALVTLTSLLYLTRPDEVVLVAPLLLLAAWRVRRAGALLAGAAAGAVPAVAWTIFSLVYYGFPFPNTAYAKLTHGIDQAELWRQGLLYAIDLVDRDPVTAVFLVFAVALGLTGRSATGRALAAGIALYLVFVVRVGGDFMAGRFFAVPMYAAVLLVAWNVRLKPDATKTTGPGDAASLKPDATKDGDARGLGGGWLQPAPEAAWLVAAGIIAVVGAASAGPPLASDSRFDERMAKHNGIVDERVFYFKTNSLVHANRDSFRQPEWVVTRAPGQEWHVLDTCGLMGATGLDFGPSTHLLDECALADPLLARLPAAYHEFWRPGHYRRVLPAGYRRTLETSTNQLQDPALRQYYDALRLIVRGPRLFSGARLEAIVAMNLGRFDHLIDYPRYRYGAAGRPLAEVAEPKPDQTPLDAPGVIQMPSEPIVLTADGAPGRRTIEVSFDSNDTYRVIFLRQFRKVAHLDFGPIPQHRRAPGLATYKARLPEAAAREGFDTVFVTTLAGDDKAYGMGHLVIK